MLKRFQLIVIFCFFISALSILTAEADQLILQNGKIYGGKFLYLSKYNSAFQTRRNKIVFSYDNIAQLTTTADVVLKTHSGQIFKGKLIADGNGIFSLSTSDYGLQMFSIYDFVSISSSYYTESNQQHPDNEPSIAQIPTFGEEDDSFHNVFLRESAILLKPGDVRLRLAAEYTYVNIPVFGIVATYERNLSLSTSLDIGVFNSAEIFCTYPITWKVYQGDAEKMHELISDNVTAGFKYMLFPEHAETPEIITKFYVRTPTGKQENEIKKSTSVYGELTAFKSIDPVVISAKLGATLYCTDSSESVQYSNTETKQMEPDIAVNKYKLFITYGFDFGFAINKKITISTGLSGYYSEYSRYNKKQNSTNDMSQETTFFNTSLYYRLKKNQTISPSLSFSLFNEKTLITTGIAYSFEF
jgi:hypothetical protein